MTISRKSSPETFLSNLEYGEVFEFDDMVYMLINDNEPHDDSKLPCVNLSTGDLEYIAEDILVTPYYTAELRY